ncbi:hypothetical protein DRN72_04900 [Methanosarcinales archaeon]|nr:MAG: hypothetical protein DRH15_12445 [Deltaproteobacteria bacterium]RLG20621.1 MAG: hypothetical protein DRN72_04900 [Methanosarcinales archaeon]
MFVVAFIGLVVNLYVAFKLHGSHDINVKSAFLHVLTDTLSSVAVIFASIWILFTNQTIVDPILGIGNSDIHTVFCSHNNKRLP